MASHAVQLGHLAEASEAPTGGLVSIHDVWGLHEHYRTLAARLAAEGFTTLAMDLYRQMQPVEIEEPGAWMRALSDPAVLQDVQTGVHALAGMETLRGKGVGVLGFCMGGTYALLSGCELDGVAAVAPFYGILSHEHGLLHDADGLDAELKPRSALDAAAELRCPMMGFFGEDDPYVPVSDVEALRATLTGVAVPTHIELYAGAGHAFMNDTRADAHRPEIARDAWSKVLGFFREHLP